MRSNPADYEIHAPGNLHDVVALMGDNRGAILPIAGGTDVMVQFAAGTLPSRRLVNIWNLPDLRRVEILPGEVRIGAGCTYTDLREHDEVKREFPLLAQAASWIGGIANQNRGTLGGNIANASPAGDSLPALLAYDAELILVSIRGERRVAYRQFHMDYKKMNLEQDELIRAVCFSRRFKEYISYARKVGTRNAQAISKVCIAALGRIEGGAIEDVRMAVGSVAPVPLRLAQTERILKGKRPERSLVKLARESAVAEIRPIDDIRSTARYRTAVVGNLVAEFLERLCAPAAGHE
jgi:CO/xanthine dehydrogenase FAD-binding subunit